MQGEPKTQSSVLQNHLISFFIFQKAKIKTNQTKRSIKIIWSMIIFGFFWERTKLVKNPPAMRETWVLSLGWEDLEEGMAAYSSPCLENPMDGAAWGLQSTGSQRVGHNWSHSTAQANYSHGVKICHSVMFAESHLRFFKGLFPVFPGSHKSLIIVQHCSHQYCLNKVETKQFSHSPLYRLHKYFRNGIVLSCVK